MSICLPVTLAKSAPQVTPKREVLAANVILIFVLSILGQLRETAPAVAVGRLRIEEVVSEAVAAYIEVV